MAVAIQGKNMAKILILNGPNLNLLGTREPEIYGHETMSDIQVMCEEEGQKLSLDVDFEQTNSEDEIINQIQGARGNYSGIIINAAAYTHTSVAIMDALLAVDIPVIEVHLSNIFKREEFRHKSYISPASHGVICGFGGLSYKLALQAMSEISLD